MSPVDWKSVKRDKDALHARSASRSYGEKLTLLDRMRERTKSIRQGASHSRTAAFKKKTTSGTRKK
jgi:hypothetical protein